MGIAEDLAAMMAAHKVGPEVQLRQTRFRMEIVDRWKIFEGAKVLEIGCGQGDTTAVLAQAVGPAGRVTAVDSADPGYGAPVTIGASADHLSKGPLGGRVEFRLGFDVLDPSNRFPDDSFDAVVLGHCSWYFDSQGQLLEVFRRATSWAPRLCFSEWDLAPVALDQVAHLLAVLVQGQIESFKLQSTANVRTPTSRRRVKSLLEQAGWGVVAESEIAGTDLDDAAWEIAACLASTKTGAPSEAMPPNFAALIESQVDLMQELAERNGVQSLRSYVLAADRLGERIGKNRPTGPKDLKTW